MLNDVKYSLKDKMQYISINCEMRSYIYIVQELFSISKGYFNHFRNVL